jgi:integration host factor subunit beta
MLKSDLISAIAEHYPNMSRAHAELIVDVMFQSMCQSLKRTGKVEIRGFGTLKLRQRRAKTGRNPKTGEEVVVPEKKVPYWKMGKELKELLNGHPALLHPL